MQIKKARRAPRVPIRSGAQGTISRYYPQGSTTPLARTDSVDTSTVHRRIDPTAIRSRHGVDMGNVHRYSAGRGHAATADMEPRDARVRRAAR